MTLKLERDWTGLVNLAYLLALLLGILFGGLYFLVLKPYAKQPARPCLCDNQVNAALGLLDKYRAECVCRVKDLEDFDIEVRASKVRVIRSGRERAGYVYFDGVVRGYRLCLAEDRDKGSCKDRMIVAEQDRADAEGGGTVLKTRISDARERGRYRFFLKLEPGYAKDLTAGSHGVEVPARLLSMRHLGDGDGN